MQTPTPGHIVNLVMKDGTTRGMVVTGVFPCAVAEGEAPKPPMLNGTVFIDGVNDFGSGVDNVPSGIDVTINADFGRAWSCYHSSEKVPGTWHWPERV